MSRRVWLCNGRVLLSALLCSAFAASAQSSGPAEPLSVTLALKRVQTGSDGKEVLVDAPSVKPGDLVEYRAVYRNAGAQPIRKVTATLPLPEGVEYQASSARPAGAQASSDGARFGPEPLMQTVRDKDGRQVTERIPYPQYRSLRWEIRELDAGKTFEVRARGRIADTPGAQLASGSAPQGAQK